MIYLECLDKNLALDNNSKIEVSDIQVQVRNGKKWELHSSQIHHIFSFNITGIIVIQSVNKNDH